MRKVSAIALIMFAAAQATSAYAAAAPSYRFSDWVVKTYEPTPARLVYTAARSLGMLRGVEEHDVLVRIRYKGAGTRYEVSRAREWQPVKLDNYYVEIDYEHQGIRIDEKAGAARTVRVASGDRAWDEVDMAPEGPPAGQSQAVVTTPAALKERRLQSAMTPMGAIKAAKANLANAKATQVGDGLYQLSFPFEGDTMRVTLDLNRRPSKVELGVVHPILGRTTMTAEYSGYRDYEPVYRESNEPFSDSFCPSRIVQKLGGRVVLDLQVTTCWTNNPYVVFPAPGTYRAGDPDA